MNLCSHEADFGMKIEWHFSATSHGKGVCDGVGGIVKRLAARASLQKPFDQQIMSPTQLYEWAKENIPAIVPVLQHGGLQGCQAGIGKSFPEFPHNSWHKKVTCIHSIE